MDPQLEPYLIQMYQSEVKQYIDGNDEEFLGAPLTLLAGVVAAYRKSDQPRALMQTINNVTPKDYEPWHLIDEVLNQQEERRHIDTIFNLMKNKLCKNQKMTFGVSPIMFY